MKEIIKKIEEIEEIEETEKELHEKLNRLENEMTTIAKLKRNRLRELFEIAAKDEHYQLEGNIRETKEIYDSLLQSLSDRASYYLNKLIAISIERLD